MQSKSSLFKDLRLLDSETKPPKHVVPEVFFRLTQKVRTQLLALTGIKGTHDTETGIAFNGHRRQTNAEA